MSDTQKITSPEDVRTVFGKEYSFLSDRFTIHDLTLDEAGANKSAAVNGPGVYVYWNEAQGVIRVGKSLRNSKSRALTHIEWNTRNERCEMRVLKDDPSTHLILFNIKERQDLHWILSAEFYLEKNLNPCIPAARSG